MKPITDKTLEVKKRYFNSKVKRIKRDLKLKYEEALSESTRSLESGEFRRRKLKTDVLGSITKLDSHLTNVLKLSDQFTLKFTNPFLNIHQSSVESMFWEIVKERNSEYEKSDVSLEERELSLNEEREKLVKMIGRLEKKEKKCRQQTRFYREQIIGLREKFKDDEEASQVMKSIRLAPPRRTRKKKMTLTPVYSSGRKSTGYSSPTRKITSRRKGKKKNSASPKTSQHDYRRRSTTESQLKKRVERINKRLFENDNLVQVDDTEGNVQKRRYSSVPRSSKGHGIWVFLEFSDKNNIPDAVTTSNKKRRRKTKKKISKNITSPPQRKKVVRKRILKGPPSSTEGKGNTVKRKGGGRGKVRRKGRKRKIPNKKKNTTRKPLKNKEETKPQEVEKEEGEEEEVLDENDSKDDEEDHTSSSSSTTTTSNFEEEHGKSSTPSFTEEVGGRRKFVVNIPKVENIVSSTTNSTINNEQDSDVQQKVMTIRTASTDENLDPSKLIVVEKDEYEKIKAKGSSSTTTIQVNPNNLPNEKIDNINKKEEKTTERTGNKEEEASVLPVPPPEREEEEKPPPEKNEEEDLVGTTAPPPPPPPIAPCIIVTGDDGERTTSILEKKKKKKKKKFRKSKQTVNVNVSNIPKRRLDNSVFEKENLLEKGTKRFWSNEVKNILESKFQRKKKKKKEDDFDEEEEDKKRSNNPVRRRGNSQLFQSVVKSPQKSLNASIMCSKIEDKKKVIEMIRTSDEWCYSTEEGLETLSRIDQIYYMFSEEEKKSIIQQQQSDEGREMYSDEDLFILELFQLPHVDIKLRIFEFLDTYHQTLFEKLKPELGTFNQFCTDLRDSENFQNFLSLVLVITNFLNQDTSSATSPITPLTPLDGEEADSIFTLKNKKKKMKKDVQVIKGISVRSLLNLGKVKNPQNPSESLMDVVYGIIFSSKDSAMLHFREKFSPVKEILKQSLMSEKQETFQNFKDRIEKLKNVELKKIHMQQLQQQQEEDPLVKKMESLMESKIEPVMNEIEDLMKQSDLLVGQISESFGHPKDSVSTEFFSVLNEFLELLDKTAEKYGRLVKKRERIRRREERKRRRLELKKQKLLKSQRDDNDREFKKGNFVFVFKKNTGFDPDKKWALVCRRAREHLRRERETAAVMKWKFLIDQITGKSDNQNMELSPNTQWEYLKGMIGKDVKDLGI